MEFFYFFLFLLLLGIGSDQIVFFFLPYLRRPGGFFVCLFVGMEGGRCSFSTWVTGWGGFCVYLSAAVHGWWVTRYLL